ncbi:hypothetical protein Cagg_0869 [Chloroflexus aggregans DSM 9485]|uniref:Uncharacterized protein n=1 Tax=Chloroflexus aggregans (strain MD-66 / DSM 9485) TaxID=326427 RepID=B8G5S7_CHLAD|nr:hypothetical protein Cagg_0869 [Chloroflexus aggregans DSM 9485]
MTRIRVVRQNGAIRTIRNEPYPSVGHHQCIGRVGLPSTQSDAIRTIRNELYPSVGQYKRPLIDARILV